jgi:hypothetical protein
MLFLMYWELNENISVKERVKAADMLISSGHFPPENIEIIRFDITSDNWGVILVDADSAEDVSNLNNMWRIVCPGIFKMTKVSPARPVQEAMEATNQLIKQINSI